MVVVNGGEGYATHRPIGHKKIDKNNIKEGKQSETIFFTIHPALVFTCSSNRPKSYIRVNYTP